MSEGRDFSADTGVEVRQRQPSKWRQLKGRVSSWFGGNSREDKEEEQDLPRIIVTCPEDSPSGTTPSPAPLRGDNEATSTGDIGQGGRGRKCDREVGHEENNSQGGDQARERPRRIPAEKDDLARAHEDVIAQMREAMLEARGGGGLGNPGSRSSVRSNGLGDSAERNSGTQQSKPPVPPTKANAVAKIRQTIAKAKRESELSVGEYSEADQNQNINRNIKKDIVTAKEGEKVVVTPTPSDISIGCMEDSDIDQTECNVNSSKELSETEKTKKAEKAAATRAKLRAALFSSTSPSSSISNAPCGKKEGEKEEDREKSNQAKTRLRTARISAAIDKLAEGTNSNMSTLTVKTGGDVRRSSSPGDLAKKAPVGQLHRPHQKSPGDQTVTLRRSSTGATRKNSILGQQTIWQFFEEGKKKGTCRTCGYVVGTNHNLGGLTRHLSLVHQREYRKYTAMMETNWTHGMMEKNLNMRVPKNI